MIVNNSNNLGTRSNILNVKIDLNTITSLFTHKNIYNFFKRIYISSSLTISSLFFPYNYVFFSFSCTLERKIFLIEMKERHTHTHHPYQQTIKTNHSFPI